MKELWNHLYQAWFPQGLEEPDLALLKVDVERAEYWDAPSGTMAEIAGLLNMPAGGEIDLLDLAGAKR